MRKLIALFAFALLPIGAAHAQPFCPGVTPWVFDDVQASDPFCGSITWAATSNVTLGCQVIDANRRLYCPDQLVTRKQMVVFMQRLSDHVAPLTCAAGQVMKWNGLAWTCANDNIGGSGGGGTVTSVAAGTGLTATPSNPISGAGVLNLALPFQLPQGCANGQVPRSNGAGGWTCGAVAFAQGGNAFSATAVLGTTDNQSLDIRVNNARVMRYEPNTVSPNVIGGSPANNVTAGVRGATIAGGGVPAGNTDPDFGVEAPNRVTDAYGTVGGGYANRAGDDAGSTIDRPFATVGGGISNSATGLASTVGGGNNNTASGQESAVGGGYFNRASGNLSTVGGGYVNHASGNLSTVGGGGSGNTASGNSSTIVGGFNNRASGDSSTVGGGRSNTASGDYSWAAGTRAMTQTADATPVPHHGAFVWADGSLADFRSTANNEFAVRAIGGARFVTAIDGGGNPTRTTRINPNAELEFGSNERQMLNLWAAQYGIGVQAFTMYFRTDGGYSWHRGGTHSNNANDPGVGGTELMRLQSNGTLLVTGGTVGTLSDRSAKRDFAAVDADQLLAKVVSLPLSEWSYSMNPRARHIGPTSQDFREAFGLGDDDKSIATVDADGVALAAIQGLNAKVEARLAEKDAAIAARDAEIAQLKAGLAELRRAVALLNARVGGDERVAAR